MLKVNVENITLTGVQNRQALLQNINFELDVGKVYTILGKNGTGKSTLIKALTGLLNKNLFDINGTVFFNDQNLFVTGHENLRRIRQHEIRYVFQDAVNSFDPLKTFDYYFKNSFAEKEIIDSLLKYFLLPTYEEISKLYPYEVSGGMAQRLSMVLAFAVNPRLINFDEPTSGVDYAISNLLLLKLKEYTKERNNTALLVTQDINFAEKASDEIALLSDGRLSLFKKKRDFFTQHNDDALNEFINSYNEIK
jgi:ABC-type glutathione transport system ATPase component